jgi:spermidine synthase
LVINAILPVVSVLGLYFAWSYFFSAGNMPDFLITWFFSFLVMLPFCLISGALFTLFVKTYSEFSLNQKAPVVYAFEAAGSLAGGLLFTFIFIRIFSTFQILIFISSVCITAALMLVLAFQKNRLKALMLFTGLLLWVIFNVLINLDHVTKSLTSTDQQIVFQGQTPYGNLLVTKSGDEINFYENGINIYSGRNVLKSEESVHYTMLQHPSPHKVLLLSGGITGIIDELQKYNPKLIDYVELNPALIENAKRFLGFSIAENLKLHFSDPRRFVRSTATKYDVILINLPAPSTAQLNRFYTIGFFGELKNVLSENAVKSGLLNHYLTSDYFEKLDLSKKNDELFLRLDLQAPANTDFRPVAYFAQISYWLSWYGPGLRNILLTAGMLIVTMIFFLNTFNKGMFVAGFTASAIEIMVLLAFQVVFGYVYQALAVLIALFMGGLASGAFLSQRIAPKPNKKHFVCNQLTIGITAILLPVTVFINAHIVVSGIWFTLWFYLIMLLSGMMTGIHFSWATQLQKRDYPVGAAHAYGADLLGSAGGALLASIVLIPSLGLIWSGIFLLGLNLPVAVVILTKK